MQDKVGNPFGLKKIAGFNNEVLVRNLFENRENRLFFIYEKMQLINNRSEKKFNNIIGLQDLNNSL